MSENRGIGVRDWNGKKRVPSKESDDKLLEAIEKGSKKNQTTTPQTGRALCGAPGQMPAPEAPLVSKTK